MKKTASINELRSLKARNLVRGMIANSGSDEILRLIEKIRNTCSESDFTKSLEIIRTSSIFRGNAIGRDFNNKFPRLVGAKAIYAPGDIVKSIQRHSEKIHTLITLAKRIVSAISDGDLQAAVLHARAMAEKEGASIFLLRALCFAKNHASEYPDLIKKIDDLLLQIGVDSIRYLALVIRELSSEKTDYFNIADKIIGAEDFLVASIARSFVDHIPRSETVFVETLSAYHYISVFDAFIYLCGAHRLELPFVPPVRDDLLASYEELVDIEIDPARFYDLTDPYIGIDFFREAFLLLEAKNFFEYRTVHSAIFNRIEGKDTQRIPLERKLLNSYFATVDRIADIGSESIEFSLSKKVYSKESACHFQNSVALVFLLERRDANIGMEEFEFVRLMSITRDIGLICPAQYIECVGINATTQELKIVSTCLAHIKERSQLKEHELRAVIQEAALEKFDRKLTKLIEYIHQISPAVAEHLIHTADETFLSKLFQLINNPNAAIEERASILEWYGDLVNDSIYLERAKNLRIDVQISREKGTIDDSRIYVDPVKFTQWINDHVVNDMTLLLEALPQQADLPVVSLNWDKVKTALTVHDQLGSLLLKCFEEFCSNKIYGIASYLGRRIRHGTLKGTGFNDVRSFANEARFKSLFNNKEFDDSYRTWVRDYEFALDQLRDAYLHIQDKKKPDGMILKDFRSVSKRTVANHMLHYVTKSFQTNKSGVELPYIIVEYCWRLIEEDLASIRKFLMERKAKYAVFRFDSMYRFNIRHREIQEFCQELNSMTAEKFRVISSWFNKPSIASPSAEITLLFRAVVSEIKGFFTDFQPRLNVADLDFTLSGGAYFVIYDALYIIIYNSAKYGRCDGELSIAIAPGEFPNKIGVNVAIKSQIKAGDSMAEIKESILAALEGDCEDALVIEGRSGIKKLRRMEQDNYIGGVRYDFGSDTVEASFNFGIDY